MARKRLSEFRAKNILYTALGQSYEGIELDMSAKDWHKKLPKKGSYVIKVDQAIKGRFKKGLVRLDRTPAQLKTDAVELHDLGHQFLLVEPYAEHMQGSERYFSLARLRNGINVTTSSHGGIDVESHADTLKTLLYKPGTVLPDVGLSAEALTALVKAFDDNYFSFLEVNPLVLGEGKPQLLDAAVEVDDEAEFFEDGWSETDIRRSVARALTPEEVAVAELSSQSQASFTLEVINPDGAIFLLLSGGGASVIVADEAYARGYGKELANYGEYSGNPNAEETALYTAQVLSLLVRSKAKRKTLVIAGGVANFTDVRVTFKGVAAALKQYEAELQRQHVAVFVRRGGPHEMEGLAALRAYLHAAGIDGTLSGPELPLTGVVAQAITFLEAKK